MAASVNQLIAKILDKSSAELLEQWVREQVTANHFARDLIKEPELREQSGTFLRVLRDALSKSGTAFDINQECWQPVASLLTEISRYRARLGFSPSQTATFIFSLKKPVFTRIREDIADSAQCVAATWQVSEVLDALGLYTTEVHQKTREDVIARQQDEMLELSTPVVQLWDGVLALPIIGTLDSRRTQMVMEALLQRIVETGAEIAIIDITGVPAVDTLTAQHLLKTVTATRLMGAECIISGIRPQIAQTIVHLGVDLGGVLTKSSMAAALLLALKRRNLAVQKVAG